jgi:hypothetical protein
MRDLLKDWQRWTRTERIAAMAILFALALGTSAVFAKAGTFANPGGSLTTTTHLMK